MENVPRPGVGKLVVRGLVRAVRLALLTVVPGVAALFIWQDRLLWHPRPYARSEVMNVPHLLELLDFRTAQGAQTAFYLESQESRDGLVNRKRSYRRVSSWVSIRSLVPSQLGLPTQKDYSAVLALPKTMWSISADHDTPMLGITDVLNQTSPPAVELVTEDAATPPALPGTLWLVFAGNGSLVLDWNDILRGQSDRGAAFLLVDYPGYGRCEGSPSPGSIRDSAAGAMDALARRLKRANGAAFIREMAENGRRLGVLAQSMGTGPALEFAAAHPEVSRVVLVSPYTSLRDAARGVVGWPLCLLLRGNFDNASRLDALARRAVPPPDVRIFHGDEDTLVPSAQGRALAAAHPGFVRFTLVPGAGHDDTAHLARTDILAALSPP